MSDIVERLMKVPQRVKEGFLIFWSHDYPLCREAAAEILRLRAENEKLRLELDMQQATVMVPSQKDDRRTIDRLNEALVAALNEAAKLRKALQPFAAMAFLNNMQEYAEAPDECVMTAGSWGNKPLLTFRLGDLRAAAAALKETE